MATRARVGSRSLRNRHASSPSTDIPHSDLAHHQRSPSIALDDSLPPSATSASASNGRDWSPAAVERGPVRPMNGAAAHHLKTPLSPPLTLPSGASTPEDHDPLLLDPEHGGGPIVAGGGVPPNAAPAFVSPSAPPAGWLNMPNKFQLAILAGSRFVDFFQMAAIQTFMVHQLKSFDPSLPDSVISHQAGVLQGAFTAAQIITSVLWGRAADQPAVGRKLVLLIGLIGTGFGCIGVAFSTTYGQAVFWRLASGAINGTVGSARTMVAEATPKPWHPRAFLLLPAAFNVANVLGPILAGVLAEPYTAFPRQFGPGGTWGGPDGVLWLKTYPYALANLISTLFLFGEAIIVHFLLDETLKGKRPFKLSYLNPVPAVQGVYSHVISVRTKGYRMLHQAQREGLLASNERASMEMDRMTARGEKLEERVVQRLPFRRIWTPNVLWVLLSIAVFDFHMGAFANLWILFLATPRQFVPQTQHAAGGAAAAAAEAVGDTAQRLARTLTPRSVFKFYGGLAFPPPAIGLAMAIIGFIGVALQFILYPYCNARYGLMRCFRGSLFFFPLAYYLAPYLALLPSTSPPPGASSGALVWSGISFVLLLQVAARTFALPASIILLNNSSPHPSVLGTIHGVGQACSATFRTLGPMLAGYWYGTWTDRGVVGMAWWIVGSIAAIGCVASFWVRNGSGHEIFLPGEEQEMKEADTAGGSGDGR